MIHHLVLVALLIAYSVSSVSAGEHVDWSSFEVQALVNNQENLEIVKRLPFQQYWDVQKGSFRSGLIGETISGAYPQFVSYVERKVVKGGRTLGADSHVVDTTSLFMCSLSAVQELINTELQLSTKYETLSYYRVDNRTCFDSSLGHSIEDLNTQEKALQLQDVKIQKLLANYNFLRDTKLKLLDVRKSFKLDYVSKLHTELIEALTAHMISLNSSRSDKFANLFHEAQTAELVMRFQKQGYLEAQHEADVHSLRQAINITMLAVAYRAAAELSAAQAQRAFEEGQLLATRTELLQAEVETLINTFFEEVYGYVAYVHANPAVSMLVLRNVLLGVFLILLIFELGNLIMLVSRKLSANSSLPSTVRLKSLRQIGTGSNSPSRLVWAPTADQQIRRALMAMSTATMHRLPLPNLLVSGPAGSGKSSMCQTVLEHIAKGAESCAASSALSALVVCGADLQALGNGTATGFLNDLLGKYSRQQRESLVLVIDDADSIIAARDKEDCCKEGNIDNHDSAQREHRARGGDESVHGSNANGSLFALLTGLRENSPFVSVVMTVRMPLQLLDSAVLDRLDHCIELALPSPEQRLLCMLEGLSVLKQKSFPSSSIAAVLWTDWAAVEPALQTFLSSTAGVNVVNEETTVQLMRRLCALDPEEAWSNSNTHTLLDGTLVSDNSSSTSCPEMDLPEVDRRRGDTVGRAGEGRRRVYRASEEEDGADVAVITGDHHHRAAAFSSANLDSVATVALLRACLSRAPDDSFQVLPCLRLALLVSAGWSYRDLKKLFSALNYTILCSDRCRISNHVWLKELIYSLE